MVDGVDFGRVCLNRFQDHLSWLEKKCSNIRVVSLHPGSQNSRNTVDNSNLGIHQFSLRQLPQNKLSYHWGTKAIAKQQRYIFC